MAEWKLVERGEQVDIGKLLEEAGEGGVTVHPMCIPWGKPMLVPDGKNLTLVRGLETVRQASDEEFAETMPMEIVTGVENDDGTKTVPTPEEVIDALWRQTGYMAYDGESQHP